MNFLPRTALAAVAAVSLALSAQAAQTLRLNHNNPAEHPTGQSLEFLAKRVNELTDGEIRIRVFHNAQLGTQRESTELVQQGALDMARSNAAELEAFAPLYGVLNLPYVFDNAEHNFEVLQGEVGRAILESSKDKGFVGLGYLVEGARSFYANKPILSPDDLKGVKVRVQPSPSAIRMIELLGGAPTPISWGELYSALQQGVVDAAENNPTAITSARHGEVSSHFSFDEHTMIPAVVFISTQTWDRLTDAQRDAFRQAAREMEENHLKIWNEIQAQSIKDGEAMGVTYHQVEKGPFVEAVAPMIEEAKKASPEAKALIEKIRGE